MGGTGCVLYNYSRMAKIPLFGLERQRKALGPELRRAAARVLDSGSFILGEEGRRFEAEFSRLSGLPHAAGVASGTDALRLALEAVGVGPGDEVIVPAFTFIATATAVSELGARPVFADVDPKTLNLDPLDAARRITKRTKALVPVHLFGLPADMAALGALARKRGLKVVEDCAQAHLARYRGRPVGTWGDAAAFSFYPTKNLGAAGDAGAVGTTRAGVDAAVRQLRNAGRGPSEAYRHLRVGHNSRLDELQAAVLRVKLPLLRRWTALRRRAAGRYDRLLAGLPLGLPDGGASGTLHSYHLYMVRTPRRDELARHLGSRGIASGIYYSIPLHLQPAYRALGGSAGDFPEAESAARECLALPMFPELEDRETDRVAAAVRAFFHAAPRGLRKRHGRAGNAGRGQE